MLDARVLRVFSLLLCPTRCIFCHSGDFAVASSEIINRVIDVVECRIKDLERQHTNETLPSIRSQVTFKLLMY